ncbi:DNA polymerase IV [candidate division KSB1 bacterium]|nr:DNA polymerase IV [candidate division KSB1 bacterium]
MPRVILHIDMDAFFAAVEQLDHPEMRGKPVIVGADPKGGKGRGVVSTCSYEARRYGIHSAMPITRAWKLCPHALFVRPRGERYAGISQRIMAILHDFTPLVEPLSIDEAFLDITSTFKFFGSTEMTAKTIKDRIRQEIGLTASVGVAGNKFVAKIASDLQKPNGLVIVMPGTEKAFLAPLEIERLWGVGRRTLPLMHRQGIFRIGDLARMSEREVVRFFGDHGLHFQRLANGIDDRVVGAAGQVKSMSKEVTFSHDRNDTDELLTTLRTLCDELAHELRRKYYRGRTITIKIRLSDFSTFTRARTLSHPAINSGELYNTARDLFQAFDRGGQAVRLIGVGVSHFEDEASQLDLFQSGRSEVDTIDRLMDRVKEQFGQDAIRRASASRSPRQPHSPSERSNLDEI